MTPMIIQQIKNGLFSKIKKKNCEVFMYKKENTQNNEILFKILNFSFFFFP